MGVWDWNDVEREVLPTGGVLPKPILLIEKLEPLKLPINDVVTRAVGVLTRPMIEVDEYSASEEASRLFEFLRKSGSSSGYVLPSILSCKADLGCYYRIKLTQRVAEQIEHSQAFDPPMIFIDEQMLCTVVTWWSDWMLLSMEEAVFDAFLSQNPIDFVLWADDPPKLASCYKQAAEFAAERRHEWLNMMKR